MSTLALTHSQDHQPLVPDGLRPERKKPDHGIEQRFDVSFIAKLALKEKQIQQNVRPVIAVHKWFARRPGSLFRALLLSEFIDGPLRDTYFASHDLNGLRIADPFMGGGTPLLEANRLGCDVVGWDVNPMAWWIVRQEISHLDLAAYLAAAHRIEEELRETLGHLYRTQCLHCRRPDAEVKYFIWVKIRRCDGCRRRIDLFPGYLLAADQRHPKTVLICSACGDLNEVDDPKKPGPCQTCEAPLILKGPALRGKISCPHCGTENACATATSGPPQHRMIALEYLCWHCKPDHRGRFFKKPDAADRKRFAETQTAIQDFKSPLLPEDSIPRGDETDRLHRWGYRTFREMFNPRQILGLVTLGECIVAVEDPRIRSALATNLSDLLRYQNMLCRYDTRSLKSLDIFSVHGFPVGLVQCESNLLGFRHPKSGLSVGSGGWTNIVDKFSRAKKYCDHPFEIRYHGRKKHIVPMVGEWIGEQRHGLARTRGVQLHCGSATHAVLKTNSLDAVFTDPPYFANVQYAELMHFCYVWLRKLVGPREAAFQQVSTHREGDLTGNTTLSRGLEEFVAGLSKVYTRLGHALRPGHPFAFTYHHNTEEAYYPVAVALLDAQLVCTVALPCPAEMGGSIHIFRSESSIVDTVFVCRSTGRVSKRSLVNTSEELTWLVMEDLTRLREAEVQVTLGDARCLTFGHRTRLAIWKLHETWDRAASWADKLVAVAKVNRDLASWEDIREDIQTSLPLVSRRSDEVRQPAAPPYGLEDGEIEF